LQRAAADGMTAGTAADPALFFFREKKMRAFWASDPRQTVRIETRAMLRSFLSSRVWVPTPKYMEHAFNAISTI
jgi:hypothetical protein